MENVTENSKNVKRVILEGLYDMYNSTLHLVTKNENTSYVCSSLFAH